MRIEVGKAVKRISSLLLAVVLAVSPAASSVTFAEDVSDSTGIDSGIPSQISVVATNESAAEDESEEAAVQTGETAASQTTSEDTSVDADKPVEDPEASSKTFIVTLDPAGGSLPTEWIETANKNHFVESDDSVTAVDEDGVITITVSDHSSLYLMAPTPASDDEYFAGWVENSTSNYDAESDTLVFDSNIESYSLTATYSSVVPESEMVENARTYTAIQNQKDSGVSLFALDPNAGSWNYIDLVTIGFEFIYEDGQIQTFTAPYDGEYIITAYGANGGTGYGKYAGYGVPGRGGMTEATVSLKKGQTIYMYIGEAGGDWSTERTFGGGGGSTDLAHAWYGSDDGSAHIFGRGGGATYISIDEFDMANAGQAQWDFTAEQQAQNDAAAEEAKKHIIMVAAGGGGAGEMGSPYSHYGLPGGGYEGGILRHHNQYYLPMEQVGQVSYDATVGGRTLTREERLEAWIWPATQTRAGYGLHYSILGNLYDPNPANKDPIELLYPEREARNWGSFFFGSNAMACTGAGGGGWFGGGTDYSFDGGGGSSYIGTSLTNADGSEMTITDPETVAGGNVKYDNTKSSPFYVNGRVLIRLNGTTPEMNVVLQEAANEEGSKDHVDENDIYGQSVMLNKGEDVASETVTYTAIIYYTLPDIVTVTPAWSYNTYLRTEKQPWTDAVAKGIDSRLEVNFTNTDIGIPEPGDKYYNEDYPGWSAIKSVMTITNPVNSMYDTSTTTKYYFSCTPTAYYSSMTGTHYLDAQSLIGGLTIDYDIFLNHNGVHVYDNRNIINGQEATTFEDTVTLTDGHDYSVWQYPELSLIDVNHINTVLVQFSSHDFDTRDRITYDSNLANSLGISGSGNQYTYVFRAKTKDTVATTTWEQFLRTIQFTTYDAAEFSPDGVKGGVSVFWYADENLWENDMFFDSSSEHFYAYVEVPSGLTWDAARAQAKAMYNSALDCYGYLAHITSRDEADFLAPMFGSAMGWIGGQRRNGTMDWYWIDGPADETATPFFRQRNQSETYGGGTLLWGYENFNDGEPNAGYNGIECNLQYYVNGFWNDLRPSEVLTSFIVEWGDDGLQNNDHSVSDTDTIGTQVIHVEDFTSSPKYSNIAGVVWAENDGNGVYNQREEVSLDGISVELINSSNSQTISTTTTGTYGEYSFSTISEGDYKVRFTIPDGKITGDYLPAQKGVSDDQNAILNTINQDYTTDSFTVSDGNDVTDANCAVYIPSSISGYVWDDYVTRDGIFENKETTIEGLNVSLQQNGEIAKDAYGNDLTTVTDSDGGYVFENVPASGTAYDVVITSGDDISIESATVSPIPDSSTQANIANTASPVSFGDISASQKLEQAIIANLYIPNVGSDLEAVDLEYKNCALSVRNTVWGYVWAETDNDGIMTGTNITTTTENPLPEVKVTLLNAEDEQISLTYTSETGYYEFGDLEPGEYKLLFEAAEGFDANGKLPDGASDFSDFQAATIPADQSDTSNYYNNAKANFVEMSYPGLTVLHNLITDDFSIESATLETPEDSVKNLNAALFAPSAISGRVWEDYDQDGIREENEVLLDGVSVTLLEYVSGDPEDVSSYTPYLLPNGKPATIQTNEYMNVLGNSANSWSPYDGYEGFYAFYNLPSGRYALKFESGDFDIRYYIASPKNAGDNPTRDSDVVGTYTEDGEQFVYGFVSELVVPAQAEMDEYDFSFDFMDFGAYQKLRDVTVTKQIHASEIEWNHGTPTFMITVYGTDQKGVFHEYNHAYEFTPQYVKDNTDENGIVSMTYTFEGIPYARIYNVEEQNTSRFCLEAISGSDNATFEGEVAALDLKYDVSGEVTFLNKVSHYRDTSANSLVTNSLLAG